LNRPLLLKPDRWLLVKPGMSLATLRPWLEDSEPDGLAALRDRSGQIVEVDPTSALAEVSRLARDGNCGTIHLVVADVGEPERELARTLEAAHTSVRLVGWYDAVLQVVASLNSPEAVVARRWAALRTKPEDIVVPGVWPEGWCDAYVSALDGWADALREQSPEVFEDVFEAVPVAATLGGALARLSNSARTLTSGLRSTVADGSSALVRLVLGSRASGEEPIAGGTDGVAYAAGGTSDSDRVPVLRRWDDGSGVVVSIRQPDADGPDLVSGREFEVCVTLLDTPVPTAQRIERVRVHIGDVNVELDEARPRVIWTDSGEGGALALSRTVYTEELKDAVLDPATQVGVVFGSAPAFDTSS
jgi:hypothetical protein